MTPSSRDLRLRIVQAYTHQEGSMRQLASRFCVSLGCVRDLLRRYRATGDVAPKPHGGGAPTKLQASQLAVIQRVVQQQSDATLAALCTHLQATTQVTVSSATMSRALTKLGLSRKKNVSRC
jgi:transposase